MAGLTVCRTVDYLSDIHNMQLIRASPTWTHHYAYISGMNAHTPQGHFHTTFPLLLVLCMICCVLSHGSSVLLRWDTCVIPLLAITSRPSSNHLNLQ